MFRQKGVITIYLAMVFLLVLSLVFTIVESARLQASRMLLETAVDAGIESFAAGFQKELYEEYDVFFFDGSFGSTRISVEGLEEELQKNMNYTLYPKEGLSISNSDFYKMQVQQITMDKLALATDDNGMVFRNQVIDYVRSSMGTAAIEQLTKKYNWAMNNVDESNSFAAKEQETTQSLVDLEDDRSAIDAEKSEEAQTAQNQKNPTAEVEEIRSMGILELMYSDTSKISQKSVDIDSLPSKRELSQGTGLDRYEEGVVSNILFQNYLMHKFTHAASQTDNKEGNLQYQIEYLLIGEGHDVDNLKGVINRLLLIREGANFTYLLTDAQKVAEAYSAATLLVGYTGLVPLIEATKYAILLSWAYAESVLDLKILLAGKKVALVKSVENWKTSLANIGQLATMDVEQMEDSSGITYEGYLQTMILIENQRTLAMRALDLIEIQMKQVTQNPAFRMDNCVAMIETTVEVQTDSIFLTLPFMKAFQGYDNRKLKAVRKYAYEEMR